MPLFRKSSSDREHKHRFSFRKKDRPQSLSSVSTESAHRKKTAAAPSTSLSSVVTARSSGSSSSSSLRSTTLAAGDSDSDEARDSVERPHMLTSSRLGNSSRVSDSSTTSASSSSQRSMRNSTLADYRQLRCSMTYKNRQNHTPVESFRSTATTRSSMSDGRYSSDPGRMSSMSNNMDARISDSSATVESTNSQYTSKPTAAAVATMDAPSTTTPQRSDSVASAASSVSSARMSDVRMTEANVAAMQTRRAFQQMVLAMEDDDSENDYESDSDFARTSSLDVPGGIVTLGADEYRKFQFRLRQLEELCAEQATKQAHMEETIEREVQNRTKKVVEAMEKKIAMYKQAKDLECEREIQRRISEMDVSGSNRASTSVSRFSSSSSYRDSQGKGKPLEKIFHPRRTKRRLELVKQQEEQQKREMEQFREFIRNTEVMHAKQNNCNSKQQEMDIQAATESLKALNDPYLTENLLDASQNELVEMIVMLRKHMTVQDTQLEEAKTLISAAIEAREEAEETAREAVSLTLQLDSRLERASHDLVLIRDELRRSNSSVVRCDSWNSTQTRTPSSSCS